MRKKKWLKDQESLKKVQAYFLGEFLKKARFWVLYQEKVLPRELDRWCRRNLSFLVATWKVQFSKESRSMVELNFGTTSIAEDENEGDNVKPIVTCCKYYNSSPLP